jgi:hypothetical protein
MTIFPRVNNGRIHWEFENANIKVKDIETTLNGTTEIS